MWKGGRVGFISIVLLVMYSDHLADRANDIKDLRRSVRSRIAT